MATRHTSGWTTYQKSHIAWSMTTRQYAALIIGRSVFGALCSQLKFARSVKFNYKLIMINNKHSCAWNCKKDQIKKTRCPLVILPSGRSIKFLNKFSINRHPCHLMSSMLTLPKNFFFVLFKTKMGQLVNVCIHKIINKFINYSFIGMIQKWT